jgi:hypothetical protein
MIPKDLDIVAFTESLVGPGLDEEATALWARFQAELGPETYAAMKVDFDELFETMTTDPEHVLELLEEGYERWKDYLAGPMHEACVRFVERVALSPERYEDFAIVMRIFAVRRALAEPEDPNGLARPHQFFKECYSRRLREMARAVTARREHEIAEAGDPGAQHLHGLKDLRLLLDLPRALEGTSITRMNRELHKVWFDAYERPVRRVVLLLWFFGQECRAPGGSSKSPPTRSSGAVGPLFTQARDFMDELGFAFPFHKDLNVIRNAMHGRLTDVRRDGTIAFQRPDGPEIVLTFEELYELASRDVEFAVMADQALDYAFITTLDEQGHLDEAWTRLTDALASRPTRALAEA